MRSITRVLLLALLMGPLGVWGCDDGGTGDADGGNADVMPDDDMGQTGDDMGEPEPDPDMGEPDPDMGEPDPDMGEPEPDSDMGQIDPDMGQIDPDMGEPEPDMGEPDPDMGEPCEGAGEDCTVGEGACAAEGVTACDADGALFCDAEPGEPDDELCANAIDDDCDGEVDEPECACADDAECPEGELCIDDACAPGDCREDGECGDGELCIDNGCRPGTCRVNADCAEGEICAANDCVARPAACDAPQRVGEPGVFEGSTVDGPAEVGASCGGGARSPEAAFEIDLGVDGPVCLSTIGSTFDTVLHVQARCGDPGAELACNDDVVAGNLRSQVEIDGADPFFAFVDGFGGESSGDFVFSVSLGACPCLGDAQCADGEVCRAGACAPVVCGDGAREGDEECDDGGIDPGDGCDDACLVEDGYLCVPQPADAPDRCRLEICVEDDDCFDDEICAAGACVVGDCRDDGECGEGELCIDNTCTAADCRVDADCGDGQICDGNTCADAPDEGTLRLVDGEDEHIGRVEVFLQGTWGTVCDDAFDDLDAEVVCRQLGFPGAVRQIQRFGGGEEPTWLDEVQCIGDEARLVDCPANPIGDEDCSHFEDVGVECLRPCEGDGDCFDGEACFEGACRVPADEVCDNGVDDDLDGATDCDDDACAESPACPCPRDDFFEDDSDVYPGPALPAARLEGLALCDDDIYNFELCAGGTTRVTIGFEHAAGNIDAVLGNGSIEEEVAEGRSETDDEVLEYTNDTGAPAQMDIFLNQGATGSAYSIDIEIFDCDAGAELCANGDDDDDDGFADCDDPDCFEHPLCAPLASACEAPIALPGAGVFVGDTAGGPSVDQETDPNCIGSPTPAGSAEVVYAFSPDADGTWCFSTLGSTFDTVLYVRADVCEDPEAEVACNDDNADVAGGTRSALTLDVVGGSTYFVFVDGFSFANDGPYALRVSAGECEPPVEICDNGVNDDLDPQVDCDDPDCVGSEACLALNCGNGVVDFGEGCDDGGREPDDGCDAECLVEPGYICEAPAPDAPSECRLAAQCGDGVIDDPETCDDENADGGDGCDALCTDEVYTALRGVEQFTVAFPEGAGDVVRFVADTEPTRVVARTGDGAGGCIGDTVLDLFALDAEGNRGALVRSNDDGGGNGLCSLIDFEVPPGHYELLVTGFDGLSLTDVVVDLRVAGVISGVEAGQYAGALPEQGDDLFELELDRAATVTFATGDGADGCPGDTVLTVFGFDADGVRQARGGNDDGGDNGLCSQFVIDLLPGRYEVEVGEFRADEAIPAYVLAVDLLFPECGNGEQEFGEACDDGNDESGDGCDALCSAETFDAVLAVERFAIDVPANAVDRVRFTVDHDPSRLVAQTSDGADGCPGDTFIEVYPLDDAGERGPPVLADDDGGAGTCSLIDDALPPGDYELDVFGFGGNERRGVVLDYRLEVDVGAAGAYDGAVAVAGTDLYVFGLEEPARVTLSTGDGEGGCPGDTRIFLYAFDDDGERFQFAANDDGGDNGLCSQLVVELAPGDYEVEVDEFGRDAALAYVLTVDGIGEPVVEAVEVSIANFAMDPDPVVVPVGGTVRWTNLDDAVHTVTSGAPDDVNAGILFDSGNLARGDSFEYTFRSVGEYTYFCRPHAGFMRDYVVIVEGAGDPALAGCTESCEDLQACFGVAAPDCVEGCMASPENQAAGQCIADGLDPESGQCDFAVLDACNGR